MKTKELRQQNKMSVKDIELLEKLLDDLKKQNEKAFDVVHERISKLSNEFKTTTSKVAGLDTGIAVVLEKLDHITFEKVKNEITQQIKIAQSDCPTRKNYGSNSSDKIKNITKKQVPVTVKDLIYSALALGAGIAGYLNG